MGATMTDWRPGSQWAGVQKNVDKIDPWFEERYHRGAHVPLLAGLIQDKPVCGSVAFFDKPLGSSIEISQHIDGPSGETGATIWVALDTADRDNGCLCYVKGSHLRSWSADELKALDEDSDGAFVFEAAPGDAIIHSARVVHWSRKSTSTTRRRSAGHAERFGAFIGMTRIASLQKPRAALPVALAMAKSEPCTARLALNSKGP